MRSFVLGVLVFVGVAITVLSARPGGLRVQLRYVARRLRIVLVLGGVYVLGSSIVRLVFPQGTAADFIPLALALVLLVVFLFVARDPAPSSGPPH